MDCKQAFINWISTSKLKNTTPIELANTIEVAFCVCFDMNVWEITDPKIYSDLRNKIILDKKFKKKDKKTYKQFVSLSKHYQVFLKNVYIENAAEVNNDNNHDVEDFSDDESFKTGETADIYKFFNDYDATRKFYEIYKYALSKTPDLTLDIRVSIIGVKLTGERLRFYSDSKFNLKFTKINKTFSLSDEKIDLDDVFEAVDEVNDYFAKNQNEMMLSVDKEDDIGFVYHLKFGFGIIVAKEANTVKIKFDDELIGIKTIQLIHPTCEDISKQDYENKIVPEAKKEESSSTTRVGWDKFETALLIEAFWKIENNEGNKSEILSKLSNDLRTRAIHNGQKIDDKFRNLNGMNIQLSNIALSFYPDRSAMHRTAMFDAVANIYKNNREEFERILYEAHKQVIGTNNNQSENKDKKYTIAMSEVDFYSFIEDSYIENHKTDGKAYRAAKHAQRCIDLIRDVNDILNESTSSIKNVYSITNINDLSQLMTFIKTKVNGLPDDDAKWIWYALNRYKAFIIEEKSKDEKKTSPGIRYENQAFYIRTKDGISAQMIIENGKYKVLAGSNYVINPGTSFSDNEREKRRELQLSGVIKDGKFLRDYVFNSSSTAAKHILARSANGNVEWKPENGQTLGDALEGKKIIKPIISNSNNGEMLLVEERLNMYPDYRKVLEEYFSDGFAYENEMRKRKFKRAYSELNGKDFDDTEEQYKEELLTIGFCSEGKIYLPSIIDEETHTSIKQFIDKNLGNISSVIYYSVIYDNFADKLNADFSVDMLKKYLKFMFAGVYKFDSEYLSKFGESVDFKQDLIDVFINTGHPMELSEIYSKLPNVTPQAIDEMLRDRDFVVNYRGKSYFYKDIFQIEYEQLNQIRDYLKEKIKLNDQVSGTELYKFIVEEIPELLELNPEVTDLGFKNAIKLWLDDEFSFKGDVISEPDRKIDVKELYREFCRNREKFTLEELETFRDSIHKTYIDYYAVFEVSIRVNADTYLRRDLINFDVEKIDNAILNYCSGKYISYLDVINFIEFPTLQYPWNYYVLEGYLFSESKKFATINAAFNKEKPVGAIIRKDAYDSFDDLIVDVIKENRLFNKEKAFEYLQENDYILTRKFKNIDLLISKAKI